MAWDRPEISTDPDEVTTRILDGLGDRLTGWEPVEGAPEVALAEELGRETAILGALAVEVIDLAAAGFGETVFRFSAFQGEAATIAVQLTLTEVGEVLPAGFLVVGVNANGDEVAFELTEETTPATTTPLLTLRALDVGTFANGVPDGDLTVVTATATVVSATAIAQSTGGVDPESLGDYLSRLTDYVATLRPGGVLGTDLAALARSVPGVYRALGVDLYDPAAPLVDSERTVTVFPVDETGAPVSPAVAAEVLAELEASREVNFIVHVAEPTYTGVDVVYTAVAEPGAVPSAVEAAADAAVLAWLAGFGSTAEDPTAWVAGAVVRYLDLARVIGTVPGVAFLSALTINGVAGDLTLTGVAPLPALPTDPTDPSTVAGTVTA